MTRLGFGRKTTQKMQTSLCCCLYKIRTTYLYVWGTIFSLVAEGRGPRCAEVDEAAFAAGIEAVHTR